MTPSSPSRPRRAVALVGLSGAGKSTTGRLLAARLGWPLLDTDALLVGAASRSVTQVFAEEGETGFRAREAVALREALAAVPCVVATGGGIVLREENRALLRERAYVIWLDAPTDALLERLRTHDEPRPLLDGGDPAARLEALRAAREALYAEIADLRVETAGRAVEEICEQMLHSFPFWRSEMRD